MNDHDRELEIVGWLGLILGIILGMAFTLLVQCLAGGPC